MTMKINTLAYGVQKLQDVQSDSDLLNRLRSLAGSDLSAHELRAQKVSFILGLLPSESDVTRADVNEVLNQIEGSKAA